MKRILIKISTLLLASLLLAETVAFAGDYKIGVLAKRGAAKAMKKWGSTADYLTNKLQADTFTMVPLDFEEVFPAIEYRELDFFLVNSSMFVTAIHTLRQP